MIKKLILCALLLCSATLVGGDRKKEYSSLNAENFNRIDTVLDTIDNSLQNIPEKEIDLKIAFLNKKANALAIIIDLMKRDIQFTNDLTEIYSMKK